MNRDLRHQRVRVRAALPVLAAAGLDAHRLAAMAARMGVAAHTIDGEATAFLATSVAVGPLAVASLDPVAFAAAPSDVRGRALGRLLIAIGGEEYPPEFNRVAALADAIRSYRVTSFKRTLAGVVVQARAGRVLFYRELGRVGLSTRALRPGLRVQWDHRFEVIVTRDAPPGLRLGPLGEDGRRTVGPRPADVPAAAVAVVPALRRRGRLVAVPSIGWGDPRVLAAVAARCILSGRLEQPPLFPDFPERGLTDARVG